MASGYKVYIPNGTSAVFSLHEGQTWKDVVNNYIIPSWMDYCNNNWLSANHENMYCGERKVKSFLNQCAYLLSLDTPGCIESEYRRMRHEVTEIPVSCAPQDVNDAFYSAQIPPMSNGTENDKQYKAMIDALNEKPVHPPRMVTKKKTNVETKFMKINRLMKQYAGGKMSVASVDTDGVFEYCGKKYIVSPDEAKYQPVKNQDGEDIYAMDSVTILDSGNGLKVFDMNLDEIRWSAVAG